MRSLSQTHHLLQNLVLLGDVVLPVSNQTKKHCLCKLVSQNVQLARATERLVQSTVARNAGSCVLVHELRNLLALDRLQNLAVVGVALRRNELVLEDLVDAHVDAEAVVLAAVHAREDGLVLGAERVRVSVVVRHHVVALLVVGVVEHHEDVALRVLLEVAVVRVLR